MKKRYLTLILLLTFIIPTSSFAITKNVTINFNLGNLTLAEVDHFNTYISYNANMEPKTLLDNCTPPAPDSTNPMAMVCNDVNIEKFPAYFKVIAVVAGEEINSNTKAYVVNMAMVKDFKVFTEGETPDPPDPPEPVEGTVFYWDMNSLPATTTTSNIGSITITKHLYDGTSSPGVTGNCLQQTGVWQTYKFPMTTLPTTKGTYKFWVKHDISSAANDSQTRNFFRSTNTEQANTIFAWQNSSKTWFYVVDANGNNHRVYNLSDSWEAGVWYQYEFTWDATTGYIAIKRNGNIVAEKTEDPWVQNAPNWGSQDMFIGYSYRLGSFDEFTISQ